MEGERAGGERGTYMYVEGEGKEGGRERVRERERDIEVVHCMSTVYFRETCS